MRFVTLIALLLLVSAGVSAQNGLPANPDPNKCYVRCITPDVFETKTVTVQTRPAYTRLRVVPAQYETRTERVLVKEGYSRYEFVPATFRDESVNYEAETPTTRLTTVPATFNDASEEILVQPAVSRWEYTAYDGCESDNPSDCQVLCYRNYEAQYTTVAVKRLASDASTTSAESGGRTASYTVKRIATPASVREITVEPEYAEITKRVQVKPETTVEETVPAESTTVTQEVLVTPGGLQVWEEIDCELTSFSVIPINYELGSARLTAESRTIIDNRLLALMRDRPNVRIELNSHTDSRGTAASNQSLSERRAQSVVNYLVGKGINRSRLVARGFGESRLKNRCADGVSCSESEHAVNRRTEFRVMNQEM
ncbi:cell envelope biogenesis protein OmpA [Lewinellaceae bacterium SD302]|nr:cell envelope biogenesis protein OmpA [Lewinellaceae bacterium SD302]